MSRRSPRTPAPPASKARPAGQSRPKDIEVDPDLAFALWLGERLRRVALGATAALLTARAFWPSEPDYREDAGGGLIWVFALLIVAGVAIASALVGGTVRLRSSWADLGVIVLIALVGLSVSHAIDVRAAINLSWEWVAFGIAYLLVRNLPRTRGESTVLVGALLATAVALAVYGLFQVTVELPHFRAWYTGHKLEALRMLRIAPGSHQQEMYENRLLGSTEPYSTFALANSLAGFLVGPLVIGLAVVWDNLTRRDGKGSRLSAVLLAVVPGLALLVCLVLTKSRSAYIGLAVGVMVLAWRERHRVSKRTLLLGGAAAVAVVIALAAAGLATGRLDRLVLTQSGKSLRYRQEYWIGAWRAIQSSSQSFWGGFGPGNFAAPYVLHKLPQASEEVQDPHNFVLEVWATAGLWAVVALAVALLWTLRETLGAAKSPAPAERPVPDDRPPPPARSRERDPSAPPPGPGWLLASGAFGCVLLLVFRMSDFFEKDMLNRWLVLGVGWGLAVGFGSALWRRRPLEGGALGAALVAVLVNLCAAGGIGIPAVALTVWTIAALGQNLRDDRPCGQLRDVGARVFAFALAAIWVAILGTFTGSVTPYWKCEAALVEAEEAMNSRHREPDYDRAAHALERAKNADKFSARPWLAMASLEYRAWDERDAKMSDQRWRKIPIELYKAVEYPRPENSWSRHRERAMMMTLILKRIGSQLPPMEHLKYQGNVVEASKKAVLLYPTNASLRARLAEASADIQMSGDASKEGHEALRLDALTPHLDKKLDPEVRKWLTSKLPGWDESAKESQLLTTPKSKAK